jgi:hypothetical protein
MIEIMMGVVGFRSVDVLMETKGGKKKSSSSSGSKQYEVPLGYIIEDVRPNGGIEKFRSAAYSNVSFLNHSKRKQEQISSLLLFNGWSNGFSDYFSLQCVRKPS